MKKIESPHSRAFGLWLLSLILFWQPLTQLVQLALHDERASHILLIPVITAALVYLRRKRIFQELRHCPSAGLPPMLVGAALWWLSLSLQTVDRLSLAALSIILVWIGVFVLCYGTRAFRAALFPLLFLLLMIPLPAAVSGRIVSTLQSGSAETSYGLFRLIGVPVTRHGMRFSLPGVDIEVAEECSGIRSALSLFITGLLAGYIFLQSGWKRVCLTICLLPIAVFKNAVRIVTLSYLGAFVDRDFFFGRLHHQGGLIFSLPAFGLLLLLLWLLRPPATQKLAANSKA